MPMIPDCSFESSYWSEGMHNIAGVDEVGRGCLAGPVVAAAVILPPFSTNHLSLNDSKKLSIRQRNLLLPQILDFAIAWEIGIASVENINRHGIVSATAHAMNQAINNFTKVDAILIDGLINPYLQINQRVPTQYLVRGDGKSASIAAASIIAKVYRDSLMQSVSPNFPHYSWDQNKGYGTKSHCNAIKTYGPTPFHRHLFIRNIV